MQLLRLFKLFFLYLFTFLLLIGCNKSRDITKKQYCPNEFFKCIKEIKNLSVVTNKGKFLIEINGRFAPLTAGNFLDLVNKGVYKNTIFHKVISEPLPFIVQGGDPNYRFNKYVGTRSRSGNYFDLEKGNVRFIPLEISLKNEDSPRYNQLLKPVMLDRLNLKHTRGSISMARSQSLDSASVQFYFSLRDLPELDGRYTVFGKIIEGIEVLDMIKEGDYILSINPIESN